MPPDRLIDSFGRTHNNLRISVTDRCNIRCVYCMPEQVEFMPRAALLSFEEIERFVRIAVTLGINKVRLTGGEPLLRRGIATLVEKLAAIPGLTDIGHAMYVSPLRWLIVLSPLAVVFYITARISSRRASSDSRSQSRAPLTATAASAPPPGDAVAV